MKGRRETARCSVSVSWIAVLCVVLVLCCFAKEAKAGGSVVFCDDFEAGFEGWIAEGTPDWNNSNPANGSRSIQLRAAESIQRAIPTQGYESIVVSFYLGAWSLDSANETVQALWYDGSGWELLKRIQGGDPEDDRALHAFSYALPAAASDNLSFALRFEINANKANDYGYVDDVVVEGTPIPYNLIVTSAGEGWVRVEGELHSLPWWGSFGYGSVVNLEAVPQVGWQFEGWAGDLSGSENPTTVTVEGDRAVAAAFSQIYYALSLSGDGNGSVRVDGELHTLPWSDTFLFGTSVSLEAVPDIGHDFAGWSGDLSGAENPISVVMDADKSVSASFGVSQCSLTVAGDGDGSVKVEGEVQSLPWSGSFAWGSVVNLEAVPDNGWQFEGWSGDVSGGENPTTVSMDGDKTVAAAFSEIYYALSVSGEGDGSVKVEGEVQALPWSGSFAWGSVVNLEAVPESGWQFEGWSGDVSGGENPTTVSMDGDKTVAAAFSEIYYALSVSGEGDGSVKVDGEVQSLPWAGSFAWGSVVNLEAVPDSDWEFEGWSGDLSGSENPTTVTMDGDKEVEAEFAIALMFSDVPTSHWAYEYICACGEAEITKGYADGTYRPALEVDRACMAVYISRSVAGSDDEIPAGPEEPSFSDVPVDHWAYNYIEYAAANRIVHGYGTGPGQASEYRPESKVNRAQMAVFIARSIVDPLGEEGLADYTPPEEPTFPDVPSSGLGPDGRQSFWAFRHIEYCAREGVVQGYHDGLYHPEGIVSRDQMAVYVGRAFELPM